jgi:branched-chain amino acid transport system ATP-binding protein
MILEVKNVSKKFGGVLALNNCSLQVKKRTITAIIGPNGSGKSTLFNIISRIEYEDRGEIIFQGKSIAKEKDFSIAKKGVSRTFQDARLFRNLTLQEQLQVAITSDNEKIIKSVLKTTSPSAATYESMLNLVGLKKPLNTYASDLSYGQKKLLDLSLAIAKPHALLLLDEPVAGVNPALRQQIQSILRKLKKNRETILLIEHDMNFVMTLADYIYVLNAGEVIAEGNPKEIQNNQKVIEAYLGG